MKTARQRRPTGRLILVNLGVAAIVAGTALCAGEDRPAKQASTRPAKQASTPRGPSRLHGMEWHSSLQQALTEATANGSERRDKPVFCLRVLGNLAGYM